MGEPMQMTRGTLVLLRALSEGPVTKGRLMQALEDAGISRNERSVRRWLSVLREAGFGIQQREGRYELLSSPVRVRFGDYEALAALSVLESLKREPVYGQYLASAASKLREALPEEALRFADGGRIEFALNPASDPAEDPETMNVLRRAVRQNRRVEIFYHSLRSNTRRWRTVEPVRVYYAQRAHRLNAYEREENRVNEFRVNRVEQAEMLPEKFSPEAHTSSLVPVRVRLSKNTFIAYGGAVVPDENATVEPLEDGGAIISGTTPSLFWTVREISALGPDAEVLGGPELRTAFLAFLQEILKRYE